MISLATLLICSFGLGNAPTPLAPGAAIDVSLDPGSPSRTFQWTADFDGWFVLWATSDAIDPRLRATPAGGDAVEDDNGGGGTAACLIVETAKGAAWTFELGGADAAASGAVSLRLVAAPESAATHGAAAAVETTIARLEDLLKQKQLSAARQEFSSAVAALRATDGAAASRELAREGLKLGRFGQRTGELASGRDALTLGIAWCEASLPPDHPELQAARVNLGATLYALGDLPGARARFEPALAAISRTLPDEHPDLQRVRMNLAVTEATLGNLDRARPLFEQVLAVVTRTRPGDDPFVQSVRLNLAVCMKELGDLRGALALEQQVLEVETRTLADDDPALQSARLSLGSTLGQLGDLEGSRTLLEKVVEMRTRFLPDDHPELQVARMMLALTLGNLGDLETSRALLEKVVEVRARTLPEEHPSLLAAQLNLANVLLLRGDPNGARTLQEHVLAVRVRTLPDDHPDLQSTRQNLASTLRALGDLAATRALEEKVLAVDVARLPDDHPDLQTARANLAETLRDLGDLSGARKLQEKVLAERSAIFPEGHADLRAARSNLWWTAADLGDRDAADEYDRQLVAADRLSFARALATLSAREGRGVADALRDEAFRAASWAAGVGTFAADPSRNAGALEQLEAARSLAARSAELARAARGDDAARAAITRATEDVARFGAVPDRRDEYLAALREKDRLERERIAEIAHDAACSEIVAYPNAAQLAAALPADARAVMYSRWTRHRARTESTQPASTDEFSAFVLARDRAVARVDLGGFDAVKSAVEEWRRRIAPSDRGARVPAAEADPADREGEALRRLVLDPLLPALGDAKHVVVVLDDPLQSIPLDALPSGDGRVGDTMHLELRTCLSECAFADAPPADGELLAMGGIDYFRQPESDAGSIAVLRGSPWSRGFPPLRYTTAEVDAIEAMFRSATPEAANPPATVLTGTSAGRDALFQRAANVRFLHIATHGFFAPESIASSGDRRGGRGVAAAAFATFGEEVRGLSPMLLCGLALAGANAKPDAFGRVPGIVTAEELSTLDLRRCELAVLSACDTNVGVVRAGQGIASLQTALRIAGARSVITSLWKVSDEATQALMVDFYRRIWIEREPKWRALWSAKRVVQDAKNPDGTPRYGIADWGGWVLSGAQD